MLNLSLYHKLILRVLNAQLNEWDRKGLSLSNLQLVIGALSILLYLFVSIPQWIQCDMRYFDMTVLGKFSVVMADPPWDIHMEV